jgi:hypothetical protein
MQPINGASLFSRVILLSLALALGARASHAQLTAIDPSKNTGPAMTSYEEGIASILAGAAARPAAVKPITSPMDLNPGRPSPAPSSQPPADNTQPGPPR